MKTWNSIIVDTQDSRHKDMLNELAYLTDEYILTPLKQGGWNLLILIKDQGIQDTILKNHHRDYVKNFDLSKINIHASLE